MKIGIGIDTGGTCTDAVAVDLDTGKVLAKGKTETTRNDLQIGIGKALDALPQELIRDACAGLPGVRVLSGYNLVPHLPEFFSDGRLHPNDLGFGVLTQSLQRELAIAWPPQHEPNP